jgi:anti-sigma B factor antagonist
MQCYADTKMAAMPDALTMTDEPGTQAEQRILTLSGPLVLPNIFHFQATVRADESQTLIIDFGPVPYVDSAGIGALVDAYVTRQHSKRRLALVSVSNRVRDALKFGVRSGQALRPLVKAPASR